MCAAATLPATTPIGHTLAESLDAAGAPPPPPTPHLLQIVTYMFVGLVVGCLAVIPLSYAPGAMPYIPAISVMFTGFTYWLLAVHTNILEWLAKEGEAVR